MSIKTLGASNHTDEVREENDYYATCPADVVVFLDKLAADGVVLAHRVWEPACGEGHVSKVLQARGHDVLSSDVIDRGFDGFQRFDFVARLFNHTLSAAFGGGGKYEGDILTNPPFKLASEFIDVGMDRLCDGGRLLLLLP